MFTQNLPCSLSLIDKHLSPYHESHELIDQNNAKISYSCLLNIKSKINSLKWKILHPISTIGRKTCNCINMSLYPLNQTCLSNNILYKENITALGENSKAKVYYDICERPFKLRYENHVKNCSTIETVIRYWSFQQIFW